MNESLLYEADVFLQLPVPKQQACLLVVFTYSSPSDSGDGRFYSQNEQFCYTYVEPEASQGFFAGATLWGVIGGAIALAVLVTLLVFVAYRRRAAAAERARIEKMKALRPRPQIEVLWGKNGLPIINPTQIDYEVPVGGYKKQREDGTFAVYDDDGTYAQYGAVGSRRGSAYEATYEDTYDLTAEVCSVFSLLHSYFSG